MTTHTFLTDKGFEYGLTLTDGIVRWDTNDRVPPGDCVAEIAAAFPDLAIDVAACTAQRAQESLEAMREYREARAHRSDAQRAEESAEMRAAFGPGSTVVDVITGERFKI